MNRRDFLIASAAMPALAAQQNQRIRVALWGTEHSHTDGKLKALLDSADYEFVGVCEPNAQLKAKVQGTPLYKGLRWITESEMLGDKSIQMIVVECSVADAIPMGKKVIAANKHLHLEKPPGNSWPEFKALVEEARKKKLLFQTGYVWRHNEGVNAAIEAAQQGWLGEIQLVRSAMNADRDAPQRAVEAKYKGGGLFELGGHPIDSMVRILGRPKDVKSVMRHHSSKPDKLNDNGVAVFEFERSLGILSQTDNQAGAGDHRSFEVIGSEGTFVVHPEANPPRMRVFLKKAQGKYRSGWQDITLPPQPRFVGDFAEFARALKSGQPLKLSYDHELLLHETLLRASGEI